MADEALTVQDARMAQQIIESMPGHAWAADPDGRFTYVSPKTLDFLGHARADLDPAGGEFGWRSVVHADDYDRVAARWRRCLKTGEPYETEHRLRRADGAWRWFRNSGWAARDGEGRITGWYGTTTDIDDQKRAEAALRDRERELSQLVDMVPSHLWRLTPDSEPVFFNKRMVDFLGLDVADADGPAMTLEAVTASVHPDDAAAFRAAIFHSIATGERFALRYRLRRADRVYHWMSSRAEPLRDQEGRIVQWYGLCHDIDEQVKAEEALQRRERQLQQLIDALPVHIVSWTPAGELTCVSRRYLEQTGLSEPSFEEFAQATLDLLHPEDAERVREGAAQARQAGTAFAMRYRRRLPDGSFRWMDGRFEPQRDQDGTITEWFGLSIDIDDEVRVQDELRERERFLWQLVETLPAMIDCAALDGEPVYRSQQLRAFLGYDLEDLNGMGKSRLAATLDAGVHPDDLAGVKEGYARSLATGEPYARRHRLRRFDGAYRWVETRAAPMRDAGGAIMQWNVICLDIDGEVRAQEALRRSQEDLARAAQAASLAELSASIAHEVNQPLAAIVANSNACHRWLSAAPPNIERAKITAERIVRDAVSAANVVSRIRALFRQSPEARIPVALDAVIREARNLTTEAAARAGVRLEVEADGIMPPIPFDRVQIQQVLVNLIRNGLEAMEAAAGDRVLRIWARRTDDAIRTEVSDTGSGLAFPDRIFQPFFTTKAQGMGMGLAISHSIVEAHGGRLWAVGNTPHVATFVFTLPIEAKAEA